MDKSRIVVMKFVEEADWPKTNLRKIWRKILEAISPIHSKDNGFWFYLKGFSVIKSNLFYVCQFVCTLFLDSLVISHLFLNV